MTIQDYDVDYQKPLEKCNPDELEFADGDGVWLFYGTVEAESEVEALRIASEDKHGWPTRISVDRWPSINLRGGL